MLIRNLPQESHDLLELVLDDIYGLDKSIAIAGAYLGLLKPLSDKDRVEAVLSAGFPLDPIIESTIDRIRLSRLADEVDPFYPDYKPFLYRLPDKAMNVYETALVALLEEKVKELELQLKIAGPVLAAVEPSGTHSPSGAPPSGKNEPEKNQSPAERPAPPANGIHHPDSP